MVSCTGIMKLQKDSFCTNRSWSPRPYGKNSCIGSMEIQHLVILEFRRLLDKLQRYAYWSGWRKDTELFVRRCDKCCRYRKGPTCPQGLMKNGVGFGSVPEIQHRPDGTASPKFRWARLPVNRYLLLHQISGGGSPERQVRLDSRQCSAQTCIFDLRCRGATSA